MGWLRENWSDVLVYGLFLLAVGGIGLYLVGVDPRTTLSELFTKRAPKVQVGDQDSLGASLSEERLPSLFIPPLPQPDWSDPALKGEDALGREGESRARRELIVSVLPASAHSQDEEGKRQIPLVRRAKVQGERGEARPPTRETERREEVVEALLALAAQLKEGEFLAVFREGGRFRVVMGSVASKREEVALARQRDARLEAR